MNAKTAAGPSGHIRIIGGQWRGSKIPVAEVPGLRPTSDRARETLFNWLQAETAGARVLDMFAGTGALGLEAASRGAAEVDFVEQSALAAKALKEAVLRLAGTESPRLRIHQADARRFLASSEGTWDLAFVDPPFASGLWAECLPLLAQKLAPRAHVYVETPASMAPATPVGWSLHREGTTRDVRFALYRVGVD